MRSILVIDADPVSCAVTTALLTRLGHEIHCAESVGSALAVVRDRLPSIAIFDIDTFGLGLCHEIVEQSARTAVILISAARTSSADMVAGLLAGADDYLVRPFDPDELLARARRTLTRMSQTSMTHTRSTLMASLSAREGEVLDLLAQGLTQREIATFLVISDKTVGTHVQHILAKLGLHSRAQAVAFVLSQQLVVAAVASAPPSGARDVVAKPDLPHRSNHAVELRPDSITV
jgi:two-component system nitrate/nitrite response regulator NarL